MDIQQFVNTMNENAARNRGKYHLTYGQLIEALESAPKDAVVDKRIKGIGSWRGSYIEIAIYTYDSGLTAYDGEFNGDYRTEYKQWVDKNEVEVSELPTNANKLGKLLRSILGKDFVGYKGGNFTIEEYKPLWLCGKESESGNTAIVGISKDLELITKELDD